MIIYDDISSIRYYMISYDGIMYIVDPHFCVFRGPNPRIQKAQLRIHKPPMGRPVGLVPRTERI